MNLKVYLWILALCLLLPSAVLAQDIVSVEHPGYRVKINVKTAAIVQYTAKSDPGNQGSKNFAVLDGKKPGLLFGLEIDGKTVGAFEQAGWSPYSSKRQHRVKEKQVYVFFEMPLPKVGVTVVRGYSFDPANNVISISHSITNKRQDGESVTAKVTARFSPQLPGSGEPLLHVVQDARKKNYQVLPLADVVESRWSTTTPGKWDSFHPLIGLEKGGFVGIRPSAVYGNSSRMSAIGVDNTTGTLVVAAGPTSVSANKTLGGFSVEIVAQPSPQLAFEQLGAFFNKLKAPDIMRQTTAQAGQVTSSRQPLSGGSEPSGGKPVISVANAMATAAQAVPGSVEHKPPASFATGDDLIPWYWSFQEAFLRSYAGKRAEDAIIQKVMEEMRRETTVRSCTQTGDQWFTDLGVYYVTLGCEIVVKSSKTEGRPKTGQDNNTELYLVRKDDKWVMAPEGDALGCAIARHVNNEKTWAAYNKQYPQGQCAGQASKETVKPVQAVAEVDLFSAYAFNPDGSRLYTFGNGELLIYTVADGKLVKRIPLKASVSIGQDGLRVSGDGRHVLMGTTRELYLVDVETAKVSVLAYRNPEGRGIDEFQVAFDDDAGQVVVLYSLTLGATYLDRFSIKTGKRVKQFDDDRFIHGFGLSRDGRKAAVLGKKRGNNEPTQLAFHSTRDGKKLFEYPVKNLTFFSEPVFTGNDKYVLYDLEEGMVVRDTSTGKPAFKAHEKWLSTLSANETRINGQGSLLLEATRLTKNVYLFDLKTGKRLLVLNNTPATDIRGASLTAAFSPDNQHFVVQFAGKGTLYKLNPAGIARVLKSGRG